MSRGSFNYKQKFDYKQKLIKTGKEEIENGYVLIFKDEKKNAEHKVSVTEVNIFLTNQIMMELIVIGSQFQLIQMSISMVAVRHILNLILRDRT